MTEQHAFILRFQFLLLEAEEAETEESLQKEELKKCGLFRGDFMGNQFHVWI